MRRWFAAAGVCLLATQGWAAERRLAGEGDVVEGKTLNGMAEPSINDDGDVVFVGLWGSNGVGLVRSDLDGNLSIIVQNGAVVGGQTLTDFVDPWINDDGDIVFRGRYFPAGGGYKYGLFRLNADGSSALLAEPGQTIAGHAISSLGAAHINGDGVVTFMAYASPSNGYFTPSTLVHDHATPIAGQSLELYGRPCRTTSGELLFSALGTNDIAIYDLAGVVMQRGGVVDGRAIQWLGPASANDSGELVYQATLVAGSRQALFAEGRYVAGVGDTIDGHVLTMIESPAMNDALQVVFEGRYVEGGSSRRAVFVSETNNAAPVADAGPDRVVTHTGTTVTFDGSGSTDPDGDPLSFAWTLLERPVGSGATLAGATTAAPSLVADVPGDYRARLVVSDGDSTSAADTALASFANVAPVVDAGPTQTAVVGDLVCLDGSASDANLDPLSLAWSFAARPPRSAATLSDPSATDPCFDADAPGTFQVSLVASDPWSASGSDTTSVGVVSIQDAVAVALVEAIDAVNDAPTRVFSNPKLKDTFTKKIAGIVGDLERGNYLPALQKLDHDVLPKVDGCDRSAQADRDDWIVVCSDQLTVYDALFEVRRWLLALL